MITDNNIQLDITDIEKEIIQDKPIEVVVPETINEETPGIIPKKRGRKPKAKGEIVIPENSETIKLQLPEMIGEMLLKQYCKIIIKSDYEANKIEVGIFTSSLSNVLNKYLPENAKENSDILNLIFVLTSVTISGINAKKEDKKE